MLHFIAPAKIAILIRYPCTMPLPGLANCSAFLEQVTTELIGSVESTKWEAWLLSQFDPIGSETILTPSRLVLIYTIDILPYEKCVYMK